jgi:hypothetical protein
MRELLRGDAQGVSSEDTVKEIEKLVKGRLVLLLMNLMLGQKHQEKQIFGLVQNQKQAKCSKNYPLVNGNKI